MFVSRYLFRPAELSKSKIDFFREYDDIRFDHLVIFDYESN